MIAIWGTVLGFGPFARVSPNEALLLLQAFAWPANAQSLTSADEKSVRAVVEGQLAAFAKDDAKKAFSFAAPNVREAVGNAPDFLSMVRRDYVAFLKVEGKDGDAIQRVQMLDAAGNSWLALYSLARQKDKAWRITGCVVVENKGRMA